MPAIDKYNAVHPLTVAGDHYGCHNRKPFKAYYTVQDGWRSNGTRETKQQPHANSRGCMHDQNKVDSRCAGCKWIDAVEGEDYN